jgi:hypothetical protein
MNTALNFTDLQPGLKSINFEAFGGIDGFLEATSGGSGNRAAQLRRVVPWLAKAQDMTALAVSELPFEILDDKGQVIDSSTDWQDKLGGLADAPGLFYKLASSLCNGSAYVIPTYTPRMIMDLQYCAPHTVTPQIDSTGIQAFARTTAEGKSGRYLPAGKVKAEGAAADKEMMYFWLPDSDVEIGPAQACPAQAALLSTELLLATDGTLKLYAERGFIKPTLLAAKGMANKDDRAVAEAWWNRFLRGWSSTIAKIINADSMSVVPVGAGMDELGAYYPTITKQAIENIGTAFGIPAALFMSDMAFASEVNPMIKMWYSTSVFIRIYRCIENTFNTQLLHQYGYRLKFRPETLDAFQEDEASKATALNSFADFLGKMPTAEVALESCATFGYELTDKLQTAITAWFAKKEQQAEAVQASLANAPTDKPTDEAVDADADEPTVNMTAEMTKDLDLWRQVAVRRYRKSQGCAEDWECKALPEALAEVIRGKLRAAQSEAEVLKSFEIQAAINVTDQIKEALDWLKAHEKE